ncbi:MAG: hypothetical protein E6G62_07800 [Actinobacteria bacterium]|nr:MAG: hypothetical protein E6G62_07800 [Actinomycetota bacterium]
MKRMKMMGLGVIAVFAMAAMFVASAAAKPANTPTSGRCLAHTGGKFSDANCKTFATEVAKEKFEFYPTSGTADNGESKPAVKKHYTAEAIGTTEKPIVLTGTGEKLGAETKVECKLQTSDGFNVSDTEGTAEHIKYTGCESSKVSCQTAGSAAGEILVNDLTVTYVIEKFGYNTTTKKDEPAKDKVAEKLVPKVGEEYVFFECGVKPTSLKVHVKSLENEGIMVNAKANAMVLTTELKFSGLKGNQKPEKYAVSIEESTGKQTLSKEVSLLSAFQKEGLAEEYEESGQTQVNKVKFEEKFEVNTVA